MEYQSPRGHSSCRPRAGVLAVAPCYRLLAMILMLAAAACCSLSSHAQLKPVKGEKILGIRGGYASENNSGFASVFFEYSFASHFRLAPEIGYVFSHNDKTAFILDVDMHFPFKIVSGLKVYPLAGIAYNNWSMPDSRNFSRLGADIGGGFDFYMTQNLKLGLQAKYTWLRDVDGAFVSLGIGYIF